MSKYVNFLRTLGRIGWIGFGGGSALIPVIEDEIVTKQGIDVKENIDRDVIVANITPGALPVEIASSIGRRNFGRAGMLFGPVMMGLPGTVAAILLLSLLSSMTESLLPFIQIAFIGVAPFIIYILGKYIINMLVSYRGGDHARLKKAVFLMTTVFLLACGKNVYALLGIEGTPFFAVSTLNILLAAFFCILYSQSNYNVTNVIVMIVLCTLYFLAYGKRQLIQQEFLIRGVELVMLLLALYGFWQALKKSKRKYKIDRRTMFTDIGCWILFLVIAAIPAFLANRQALVFLGKGIVSALMSFGGGDAYLTIADGLFVSSGMITESQYYGELVPIVNVLPGSILCKTLAGVGYYVGLNAAGTITAGILFAITGFVCSIASSCCFFGIIYQLYDGLASLYIFRMISRWIRPIIAGVLINIMLSLVNQCGSAALHIGCRPAVSVGCMFLLLIADIVMVRIGKGKYVVVLLVNLVVSFILFSGRVLA